MRNIKLTLAIFFGGIFALWLLATSFPDQWGVYPVRNLMLQLTGAISILAMSACLILAVRPKILETPLGGLDKMYRLHKWLGIIALSGSILLVAALIKRIPYAGLPNSTYLSSPFISRLYGTPSYWQILPIGRNLWASCSSPPYLQVSPAR